MRALLLMAMVAVALGGVALVVTWLLLGEAVYIVAPMDDRAPGVAREDSLAHDGGRWEADRGPRALADSSGNAGIADDSESPQRESVEPAKLPHESLLAGSPYPKTQRRALFLSWGTAT